MNKKEQNEFLEELKAERAEKEKELNHIREVFTFLICVLIMIGLPLTFCLIGIHYNNDMLEGGIFMFCVFNLFLIFVSLCGLGFFNEKD